jgi:hypothetical protein
VKVLPRRGKERNMTATTTTNHNNCMNRFRLEKINPAKKDP